MADDEPFDRYTIMNAIFLFFGSIGFIIMITSLVIAVLTWHVDRRNSSNGADGTQPTLTIPTPTTRIETLKYTFSKQSDLDAFTQTGVGPMKVANKELVLQTTDNNQVGAKITLTFAKGGSVTFDHRFSTEYGYDYADFIIDNDRVLRNSGTGSATKVTRRLAAGEHTIEWSYIKDRATSDGLDQYDIDNIIFRNVLVTE